MTTDEFERVFAALRFMAQVNVCGQIYVPLRGVLENLVAQLHPEDRALYEFDWEGNQWKKKEPGERPGGPPP
jgi:hypothetical protein